LIKGRRRICRFKTLDWCVFVDSAPAITAGKHVTCINQRSPVALTCDVRYSGSELMPLTMTWTTSSGLLLTNRTFNYSSVFMSSTCLPPPSPSSLSSRSSSTSYTCTLSFSQPSANTIFSGVHSEYYRQKSNAPSLTVSAVYHIHSSKYKTIMSVLLIVGPKCTLAALHAVPC